MPMHGLFEIRCTIRRITELDRKEVAPPYTELNQLPIRPVPIDHKFVENYAEVDVPYAKAADTIFLVMAKKLGLPLVTRDKPMYRKAQEAGIRVFDVSEALGHLSA